VGVKHCIAMCNGTIALEIAIRALEMKGEVIVPSMTFVATAHALQWQEITPVFCDIAPETHTIDPNKIESLITPRTSGIIGVHLWGNPCDIDKIQRIALDHGLKLLFDAAHAFCTSYKGRMIGSFGHAEIFSFHATKIFNTFEGGAVLTNDSYLARKIRLMQNFGFDGLDNVTYIGINGKMSEISAAMGLVNLEQLEEFIEHNYQNYLTYSKLIENIPGISILKYNEKEKNNYQYIIVEIDKSVFGVNRDDLVNILRAENILARRYFYPGCHRMEPYRSYFPHAGLLLPITEKKLKRIMVLPTGTQVTTQDIEKIIELLKFIHTKAKEVKILLRKNDNFTILAQSKNKMHTKAAEVCC
ncbi:MAG: dTDP-4-dehydro-6-deoxyglucose aminotransferase, partial [Thermodesulfobacteria bacterium]|nr:dTDP-4-dehydro-6-deoxyglucose aminotransferase [Thermodesulfobacteriota bacterium]